MPDQLAGGGRGSAEADAICVHPGLIELRRVRLPSLGPRDVLIRTVFSGISTGTDRWVLTGRFVWQGIRYPAVPGYQASGVVEEVGAEVGELRPGQLVVTTQGRAADGLASAWGTHASLIVAEDDRVYDASGIPPLRAAFLVVAQVGFNAASRLILAGGARVAVFGDGIVGTSAALAAKARGFDVVVVGRHEARLAAAATVGLGTLLSGDSTAAELINFAPQAVIDTVQNEAAFNTWFGALEPRRGQVVYSGHSPDGVTAWADMAELQKRELTAHFVSGMTPDRLRSTLLLMTDDSLPIDRLVGRVATRDDAAAVMSDVAEGQLGPCAAAIDWQAGG